MNNPYPVTSATTTLNLVAVPAQPEHEGIDFLGVLDTIFNARRLILAVAAAATLAGAVYVLLSEPVYQADAMVQVEQNQSENNNQMLGALTSAFSIQSPSTAEKEILRSRLVVGKATDELQLYVTASPNYLPLIGQWISQHASGLSSSGIPWLDQYVWGTESITVDELEVPRALENQPLTVLATASGYALYDAQGDRLAEGKVGQPASLVTPQGEGSILISALYANPGARFTVQRHSRQEVIKQLQRNLVIDEMSEPSGVLSMKLQGTDPERISAILNAIGMAYVGQNTARKAAEAEKSLKFLEGFLPQLKKQMDESNNRYTDFRDEHGTFNLGTEGTLSLNSSVTLKTHLFELQQKRRELAVLYGPGHPANRALDGQIDAIQKEVDKLSEHIKSLPDLEQNLLNLQRDARVNSELYASLLNTMQQLRVIKEGKVGNVRLVDNAIVPERPIKPNRPMVLTISAVVGLMLGAALAFLRNLMGSGIRGANDIESRIGMSVFATVPRIQADASRRLRMTGRSRPPKRVLALVAPDDPAVESLRSLRTSLRMTLRDAANNIVMLTGPTPNIGKTFTSINLAAVLGSSYKKVLLIDADFRSGGIHRNFRLPRAMGFADLINGDARIEDVLHESVLPHVDLITTGRLPGNPAETLLSPEAEALLQDLSGLYDVVVIDTAPVLPVSDAMALAPQAGTIFMLARAEQTTVEELDEAAKRVRQAGAHVSGIILNDFDPANHRFSAKYGTYRQSYGKYGGVKP
ncbi:polysaccharide biosynthesis tyrosine autokinase [Allopusillimonas ginsengisoli]|uniref:polysaccharide biosynthesis tyrosine autokinase n=1 Tax=Allopusillimonas ginsengisoli TaxID=453575 RepID=UPI00102269E2|nr:polysaccharide biosynthesis tyrosine autokinase [Allopusillimonas ginsengisoli]TEA78618.1 polysaccharide biosynthesis tyrosine autokinase [Allopusillimonas ginsengisoli]